MIPRLPIRAAVRWLGRRRAPLLVAWRLTERCNLRCRQCALWLDPPEELSPREAEAYAREMVAEGVLAVSLLGGEVLLREDLGRLIAILDHGGVAVRVTSNGILVPRRLDTLRRARLLKLSLDGPEEVHDSLRGQGAYAGLMAGLEAARRAGIPVQLNTVLSRELLPGIDAYLALVQRLACRVSFQPLELRAGLSPRDLDELSPGPEDLRRVLARLAQLRRRGDRRLVNSPGTLELMRRWPATVPRRCQAGRWFCRVMSDGRVVACDEPWIVDKVPAGETGSFTAGVARMAAVGRCPGCWRNNTLEINRALGGAGEALAAVSRLISGG